MAWTYWYNGIPEGGRYTKKVSVQADTTEEAIAAVRRIHGIKNPTFCGTSHGESDNEGGGFGSLIGNSFALWFIGIIAFLSLLPYLIPVIVFGLIGWGCYKFIKWILK